MLSAYTPDNLYESEKSFAIQYQIPVDNLEFIRQLRLDTATSLPSDCHRIAVWVVAPVLVSFVQWIAAQIKQHKGACCLAVMRDGWLPGKLLQNLYGLPVRELWLNRDLGMRAAFGCGDDEALLNWLVRTRLQPITPTEATERLADLPYLGPEPHKPLNLDDARQLMVYWKNQNLLPQIRARGKALAARLMQHWCVMAESPHHETLLVDFACAGNAQRSLQTILTAHRHGTAIHGLNFVTTAGTKWARQAGCTLDGFLAENGSPDWFADAYARTPELMEIFTAVSAGPLFDYTDDGTPQCAGSILEPERINLLEDVQSHIIEAATHYHRQSGLHWSAGVARCLWGRMLLRPLPAEVSVLSDWPLDAGLDGASQRVLAARCGGGPEGWTKWQSAWPVGSAMRNIPAKAKKGAV